MIPPFTILTIALTGLLPLGLSVENQDPTPPLPASQPVSKKPKLPNALKQRFKNPFAGLVPGQLPASTTAQAAAYFEALAVASLTPGALREPLMAFDLNFEIITRGPGVERNQATVRVRFQEPGFVRFAVGKDKEMGFGPRGYWQRFEDGAKFLNGRDYVSDRKRITEIKSVAKNFLVLADPARLRLQSVRVLPAAPALAPSVLAERIVGLNWLELESPDFDLAVDASHNPTRTSLRLFRATLGLHPETGRVLEALVQELNQAKAKAATSMWVSFSRPLAIGEVQLPGVIEVRYTEASPESWTFQEQVREALYLLEGKLNPPIPKETFDPPRL